jgi:hypothetical protein
MTTAGWAFLAASWGLILGLNAFCVVRLMREGDSGPKP